MKSQVRAHARPMPAPRTSRRCSGCGWDRSDAGCGRELAAGHLAARPPKNSVLERPLAGLDPVAVALERVGRQPQPAPALAGRTRRGRRRRRPPTGWPNAPSMCTVSAMSSLAWRSAGMRRDRLRLLAPGVRRQRPGPGRPRRATVGPRRAPWPGRRRSARVPRRWSTQYCGSVACSAVIQVPVRFEMYGHRRAAQRRRADDVAELGQDRIEQRAVRGGGERDPRGLDVVARRALASRAPRRRRSGPAPTHSSAALTTASDSSAGSTARSSASPQRHGDMAAAAAADPLHQSAAAHDRARARRRASCTPARWAAAYSPRLWPTKRRGVMPQAINWRASATDVRNTAGSDAACARSASAVAVRAQQRREVDARSGACTAGDPFGASSRGRRRSASSRPARHAGVLRAAAREHEHDVERGRRRRPGRGGRCGRSRAARVDGVGGVGGDDDTAVANRAATDGQRVGDVGEVGVGLGLEVVGQRVASGVVERRRRAAADSDEQLLGRRRRAVGAQAGASSTTTCALVPPTPSELMPARRGASPGHGAARADSTNGVRSRSSSGFGAVKLASGGSVRWRSACTTLIRLATPAAVSRWPMLGLVETSRQKPVSSVVARNASVSAATSIGSPTCVPVPCASSSWMSRAGRARRRPAPPGRRRRDRRRSGAR